MAFRPSGIPSTQRLPAALAATALALLSTPAAAADRELAVADPTAWRVETVAADKANLSAGQQHLLITYDVGVDRPRRRR
jgi:hypothetical protein